jgi:hypothetical protein
MWVILAFPFVLLAVLVAWELATMKRRRSRSANVVDRGPPPDGDRFQAPEAERRRRLDLSASRWPAPRGWG